MWRFHSFAVCVSLTLVTCIQGYNEYLNWAYEHRSADIEDVLRGHFNWKRSCKDFGIDPSDSLSIAEWPVGSGQYVMRAFYKKGTYARISDQGATCHCHDVCHTGAQFYAVPSKMEGHTHMRLTLKYEVYFADNFNWKHGGKLPGLWGGSQECSGGTVTNNCFSTRLMWREQGEGEVYAYVTHDGQSEDYDDFCNDRKHWSLYHRIECTGKTGMKVGSGSFTFHHHQWNRIHLEVHMNPSPGHSGEIKLWVNDKPVIHVTNLVISKDANFDIDGLFFSTFYGGGSDYYHCPESTYAYFRNFVISDEVKQMSSGPFTG